MRGRVGTVSIGLSLTLHGVIVWWMATRREGAAAIVERRTIEVDTYVTPAPATPRSRGAVASSSVRAAHVSRRSTVDKATAPSAPPQAEAEPSAPKRIDLFAPDAVAKAVLSPPPASDRDTVGSRVREMIGDSMARERAQSGNVAPHWRDIERKLVQEFHPPIGVVKQENVVKALGHQILNAWLDGPPKSGAVPRGVDASVETLPGTPPGLNLKALPEAQALAVQARWGEPAMWLRVEVEVTLDEDGHVRGARVVKPSGRRMFDRTALAAVEDAIRAGGAPDEHRTVVTRWLVEAAVAVSPPTAVGFRFDETGHMNPGAKGWRKYLAPNYPMQQSVVSHVSLVAIKSE